MRAPVVRFVSEQEMLNITGRNYSGFYLPETKQILINTSVPNKARRYVLMHEKVHYYLTSWEFVAHLLAAILAPISFLYYLKYLSKKEIKRIDF